MNNANQDDFRSLRNDGSSKPSHRSSLDRPIKATGEDAMMAKLATVKAGYYIDPFLSSFASEEASDPRGRTGPPSIRTPRRAVQPIIKKGTHARVCVMDRAITTFLYQSSRNEGDKSSKREDQHIKEPHCQIVVLGAGKDTSYFRYCNGSLSSQANDSTNSQNDRGEKDSTSTTKQIVHWYEVDHVSVVQEKAALIRKSSLLKSFCPQLVKTANGYESSSFPKSGAPSSLLGTLGSSFRSRHKGASSTTSYHLIGHDLRDSPTGLMEKLELNPNYPTLFLMECVSMYVPIDASKSLLETLATCGNTVYLVCYEPILDGSVTRSNGPYNRNMRPDPFGAVMEANLRKRGIASPDSCLLQTRTLSDHLNKLLEAGFVRVVGADMLSAYNTIVTQAQQDKNRSTEFLDEFEEWILIMKHYCLVAARGKGSQHGSYDTSKTDNMTVVLDTTVGIEERSLTLGWFPGKCTEVEQGL